MCWDNVTVLRTCDGVSWKATPVHLTQIVVNPQLYTKVKLVLIGPKITALKE